MPVISVSSPPSRLSPVTIGTSIPWVGQQPDDNVTGIGCAYTTRKSDQSSKQLDRCRGLGISGEHAFTAGLPANHRQELAPCSLVVAESTQHSARRHHHARLVHATGRHALVRRLDNYRNALRLEDFVDGIGDLRCHLFLDLQAPGVDVDNARELADAHDTVVRQVGDVCPAYDGREMVLAVQFEANIAQQHDFVVAIGFLKGAPQDVYGINLVSGEMLPVCVNYPARRVAEPFASWDRPQPSRSACAPPPPPRRGWGVLACRPFHRQS